MYSVAMVVQTDNELADWNIAYQIAVAKDGNALGSEKPRGSYGREFSEMRTLESMGVEPWEYDNCCFEGTRTQKQVLYTNIEEIFNEQATCNHMHRPPREEWQPVIRKDGTTFRSNEEEEYTAA